MTLVMQQQQLAQQQMLSAYTSNLYYNPYEQQQHSHFVNMMSGWPTTQQVMPNPYGFQPVQVIFYKIFFKNQNLKKKYFKPFLFPGGDGMMLNGQAANGVLPLLPAQQNNQLQQPQPVVEGVNNEAREQPDFLALIYKFFRFALLIIILFLYSSFERFFGAIFLIGIIWFVQQQRRQNHGEQQQINNIRPEAPDANDNNNNNVNTPNQEAGNVEIQPPNSHPQSFSAWSVFWSTVTSFFASLIPENPHVPVNIN